MHLELLMLLYVRFDSWNFHFLSHNGRDQWILSYKSIINQFSVSKQVKEVGWALDPENKCSRMSQCCTIDPLILKISTFWPKMEEIN